MFAVLFYLFFINDLMFGWSLTSDIVRGIAWVWIEHCGWSLLEIDPKKLRKSTKIILIKFTHKLSFQNPINIKKIKKKLITKNPKVSHPHLIWLINHGAEKQKQRNDLIVNLQNKQAKKYYNAFWSEFPDDSESGTNLPAKPCKFKNIQTSCHKKF